MGKLTAKAVNALAKPGRYQDGDGLMLNVAPGGSKSWVVRLQSQGRRRDYGLGSTKDISLSEARTAAAAFRKRLREGGDPLADKRVAERRIPTFREAAVEAHAELSGGWKNGKHRGQWLATLEAYAFPVFGDKRVDEIGVSDARDALAPIWLEKAETARRLRQRIGATLAFAVAKQWRSHELSMSAVAKGLARQPRKTGRFEAMPYVEVPAFLSSLAERQSFGRLALRALILTAARSGEVRGATWGELDLDAATWTLPAERMKAGRAHIVPLSPAALAVFREAEAHRIAGSPFVFPGQARGRPLSDMTLTKIMRDASRPETVHGFRSAFRDWAAERTNFPGEVAEAALAHAIPNRVEAAYRRTDFLDKRCRMMGAWGAFCAGASGNVIPLAARA